MGEVDSEKKLPALDGVRGVAISLVMLYHFNLIHKPAFTGERVWIAIADVGWAGVDLFFVLSGFLITRILLDAKDQHAGDPRRFFRGFWMRRVLRIFPLYYLFLVFSLWLMPALASSLASPQDFGQVPSSSLWFWLYVPNFYYASEAAFTGVAHLQATWSLGVEEQFYVLWPLLIWWVPAKHIRKLALAGIVVALAARCIYFALGTSWVAIFVWPHCRMDALLVGVVLATLARDQLQDRFRKIAYLVGALVVVALVVYSAVFGYVAQYNPPVYTVGFTVLAIGGGALVWLSLRPGPVQRALSFLPLRLLGKYAYGLYLVHVPVKFLVLRYLLTSAGWREAIPNRLLQLLVFELCGFVVTFAIAAALFHLFEQRFLALKRFFPR